MKRLFGMLVLACVAACGLHAQAVDTTVCNVLKNPSSLNGKTVRIKGTVKVSYDQFVIADGDCGLPVNGIWLDYPAGSKAKSGPLAVITLQPAHNFAGKVAPANRAAVTLTRDKAFKQFDSDLSHEYHPAVGLCMGCFKNEVKATLTGRLDAVDDAGIQRSGGKIVGLGGFGNLNAYPARLVIESVTDVSTVPVAYPQTDAAVKKASGGAPPPVFSDAKGTAEKIIAGMQPSPISTEMQKDLAVLGKPGEANGVLIAYTPTSEYRPEEEAASAQDSPDGVVYNCRFNKDKLHELAMSSALLHAAQHVNDIRSQTADNVIEPLMILENNAWAVSGTLAVAGGQNLVVFPGDYVMWNSNWPAADRGNNMDSALSDFISKNQMLSK